MRRHVLAVIAALFVIATPAFAEQASNPPGVPSLMALDHHNSVRSQLVAQRNFEGSRGRGPEEDGPLTDQRWEWLKGTTWYVPTNYLRSYFLVDGKTVVLAHDQTVYRIDEYKQGFFWGVFVMQASTPGVPVNCNSMIGSVTPEGAILMSNVSSPTDGEFLVNRGFGTMRIQRGEWTMEMQGGSQDSNPHFHHWAYMFQTHPGHPSWGNLPSVNMSVPAFLGQCPGSAARLGIPE